MESFLVFTWQKWTTGMISGWVEVLWQPPKKVFSKIDFSRRCLQEWSGALSNIFPTLLYRLCVFVICVIACPSKNYRIFRLRENDETGQFTDWVNVFPTWPTSGPLPLSLSLRPSIPTSQSNRPLQIHSSINQAKYKKFFHTRSSRWPMRDEFCNLLELFHFNDLQDVVLSNVTPFFYFLFIYLFIPLLFRRERNLLS